jgi:hypothetical protein
LDIQKKSQYCSNRLPQCLNIYYIYDINMAIDPEARARQRSLELACKFPEPLTFRVPIAKIMSDYEFNPTPVLISLNGHSPKPAYNHAASAVERAGDLELPGAAAKAETLIESAIAAVDSYRNQNP